MRVVLAGLFIFLVSVQPASARGLFCAKGSGILFTVQVEKKTGPGRESFSLKWTDFYPKYEEAREKAPEATIVSEAAQREMLLKACVDEAIRRIMDVSPNVRDPEQGEIQCGKKLAKANCRLGQAPH